MKESKVPISVVRLASRESTLSFSMLRLRKCTRSRFPRSQGLRCRMSTLHNAEAQKLTVVDEGDAVDDVPAELGVDNVARRIHHQTQSVRFVVFPEAEVGFEGQSLEDAEALPLVGFVDFSVVFAVQLMNGVKGERRPLMRLRCILQLFNGVLPRRLLFYGVH